MDGRQSDSPAFKYMTIEKWIIKTNATLQAIVRVEPYETPDIELMKRLLDGDTGHFGLKAELVSTEKYKEEQHGYESLGVVRKLARFYKVTVFTD